MKNIFIFLSMVFLISCKNLSTTAIDQEEISNKVTQVYLLDKNWNSTHKIAFPNKLFSPAMEKRLKQVLDLSHIDKDRVKKSNFPMDKHLIFEGSFFTSLYEGSSSFSIKSINGNHNTAVVLVDLKNTNYDISWTDKIEFMKKDAYWIIKNIIFNKDLNANKDLESKLKSILLSHKQ